MVKQEVGKFKCNEFMKQRFFVLFHQPLYCLSWTEQYGKGEKAEDPGRDDITGTDTNKTGTVVLSITLTESLQTEAGNSHNRRKACQLMPPPHAQCRLD